MLGPVPLDDELLRIAAAATAYAEEGEELSGLLAAEPSEGRRVYLAAYDADGARRRRLAVRGGDEGRDGVDRGLDRRGRGQLQARPGLMRWSAAVRRSPWRALS